MMHNMYTSMEWLHQVNYHIYYLTLFSLFYDENVQILSFGQFSSIKALLSILVTTLYGRPLEFTPLFK